MIHCCPLPSGDAPNLKQRQHFDPIAIPCSDTLAQSAQTAFGGADSRHEPRDDMVKNLEGLHRPLTVSQHSSPYLWLTAGHQVMPDHPWLSILPAAWCCSPIHHPWSSEASWAVGVSRVFMEDSLRLANLQWRPTPLRVHMHSEYMAQIRPQLQRPSHTPPD